MAGVVYLRTNRFEVKLEGMTFKKKVFESLCEMDFLFPEGKPWAEPPVVGLDVMCHPRDPSIILLLLSFGVGCVILRFAAGESLPAPIHRFLADKRVRFVGYGIPEKTDLFPFHELGLSKSHIDVGYIAARLYKDPKYRRYELGDLARKVLGIRRMIGLTQSASFDRHAQIKCAICQLFVTSLIAMGMLKTSNTAAPNSKRISFLKNLNSLQLLAEGWFKLPGTKKRPTDPAEDADIRARMEGLLDTNRQFPDYFPDDPSGDDSPIFKFDGDSPSYSSGGDNEKGGDSGDDESSPAAAEKKPIKGILKCPSTTLNRSESTRSPGTPSPSPTPSLSPPSQKHLKRANSKGCNVRFKFH